MPPHPTTDVMASLVINEMRALYGARFTQQWQGLTPRELKSAWEAHLQGLEEAEVMAGLQACLSRDWPPTLPEFLRLCRPWLHPEAAYHEAVAGLAARRRGEPGRWSHPAVYWAAVAASTHDLLNSTYGAMKARWERAYADSLKQRRWDPVPPIVPELAAPAHDRAARARAEAALARILAAQTHAPRADRDSRAWARQILTEQARRGGKRYSACVLEMAGRALAIEAGHRSDGAHASMGRRAGVARAVEGRWP
ncbi:hypothetical protein ACILG0_20755 [Pseudomonadota bacterium AL_CKDN230030165-1A_HGKHYDSX7]